MSELVAEDHSLVTKREALKLTAHHINKGGCIDLNVFIELLTWEKKLLLWVLQEGKEQGKLDELLPELSVELRGVLKERQQEAGNVVGHG